MRNKIFIITPCSRPENLNRIKVSQGEWIVIHDANELPEGYAGDIRLFISGGVAGKKQINHALDYLEQNNQPGWIYILDDDNDIHEDFFRELTSHISQDKGKYLGYLFSQDIDSVRVRPVNPDNVRTCHIDQAQFLLHTDLIKEKRYQEFYEADGKFIEELYSENKDKIKIIPKVLCHYNKLRR